jgi:hypothetical protein
MNTTINNGITFEETSNFLKWGKFINPLIRKFNGTKEDLGDRTVYHWGKHTILSGLELELTNSFWNFGKERWFRRFNKIEYWAIGDNIAKQEFDRISNHLIKLFGQPIVKEENVDDKEKYSKWKIDKIEISVFFFEQHCYKLHFTIKKN